MRNEEESVSISSINLSLSCLNSTPTQQISPRDKYVIN